MIFKNKSTRAIIIIFVGFLSLIFSANTYAATENELYRRALLNAMSICYSESEMYRETTAEGYDNFNSSILKRGTQTNALYIPTGVGEGNNLKITTDQGTKIGCYELFNGDEEGWFTYGGSMTGLFGLYGIQAPDSKSDKTSRSQFFDYIGYTYSTSTGESSSCLTAQYANNNDSNPEYKDLAKFCWKTSDLDSDKDIDFYLDELNYSVEDYSAKAPIKIGLTPTQTYANNRAVGFYIMVNSEYIPKLTQNWGYTGSSWTYNSTEYGYIPGSNLDETLTRDVLKSADYESGGWNYYFIGNLIQEGDTDFVNNNLQYVVHFRYSEESAEFSSYKIDDWGTSYNATREKMSGSPKEEFSDNDKYDLYSLYLNKVYKATITHDNCVSTKPDRITFSNSDGITYYKIQTSSGWCDASVAPDDAKKLVSGFTADERYILNTEYDFANLVEAMSKLTIDTTSAIDVTEYEPGVNGMTQTELSNAAQDPCYTSSDSLGWIICPVVKTATRAMLNMYNHIEEDFLVVESELTKSDSATRSAWNYFVNFANIAMVILLLVVIVSQITGAGIDNYGIKKLLPKIITVAILINLSFIICQLAVDVSNIVGRSLKDLLVNISKETSLVNVSLCNGGSCDSSAGWFKVLVTVAGGGIVGLGGLELVQGVLTNGMLDGLIIPILILILVAVIAVIFFFILLGLRKAAIVILIVISPLAFICYALPNTKKLFTKWFDAMKGLLLLYPLCGLVVGGGTLASKIILSASQDYVTYFIGTIIMVVPFFMIPSLLRSSFKALGGIGAKISGLGKNLRSKTRTRADRVHKNSTGYKARQADFANRVKVRQAKANNRRAGRTIERLEQKRDSGKELSEMEQARLYEATNTANSYENARADYQVGVPRITKDIAKSRAESRLQAQETKLWSEQLAKAKTEDITAEFENSLKEGNVAKMSAAFEALKNTGNLPKIHDALKRADWDKMDDKMRLALNQSMIGSGDVAMKAYAKNSFKHNGAGNFKNFMEGVDNITSDNSFTIQKALRDLGSHALDGQNKDTVDFIAKHTNSLSGDDDGWVAKMIMSGLTSTQNGEEKAKFQDMLKNYAKNSRGNFAQNIQQAINAGTLAKLDGSSFGLINDLLVDPTGEAQPSKENKDYSKINEVLSGAIADLQKANNATLLANLSNDVAKNLSVHPQVQEVDVQVQTPVQSQPQTQTQPQAQSQQLQVPHNPQPTQDHTPTTDFSGDGGMDG